MIVAKSIHFKGHRCFSSEWAGFETVKPINVIIGRNNSGKSRLLDLLESMCKEKLTPSTCTYRCSGTLTEAELRHVFRDNTTGGPLTGNHWNHHGRHLVGKNVLWVLDENGVPSGLELRSNLEPSGFTNPAVEYDRRLEYLYTYLNGGVKTLVSGKRFCHLSSERDIKPERHTDSTKVSSNGDGATSLIQRFLLSDNQRFPRDLVRATLLNALKEIFGDDGDFSEILVRQHDRDGDFSSQPIWEIHLSEPGKGIIRLSQSGSGLKTIILVLINLLLVPHIEQKLPKEYLFAFEELENNLHPALQRRLLGFIERYVLEHKCTVFVTTHSSVALDFFGSSPNAQIVQVAHNGTTATTTIVDEHIDKVNLVAELGAKPSDLLQANGVIWVEGPSDRVYINKWIELLSDGKWKEGRHYQCACYGGALLATLQFTSPENEVLELVNLLRINPNVVLVCDSDRTSLRSPLKERVRRIQTEVSSIPKAFVWVSGAKEIENYLPAHALRRYFDQPDLVAPDQFEHFFAVKRAKGKSYVETRLNRKTIDKMELAAGTTSYMLRQHLEDRFDLVDQVKTIIKRIAAWNT